MQGAVAPVRIENAAVDPRYCDHPGLELYGIHAYVAVPLRRPDGTLFGTLCALDPDPHPIDADQIESLELMATLIQHELAEQDREKLRTRWLGILAHDLRGPLSSIRVSSAVARRMAPATAPATETIDRNVDRMSEMITSILEFASVSSPDSVVLAPTSFDLVPWLHQLLTDLDLAGVPVTAPTTQLVSADPDRLGQALQNVLGNARKHAPGHAFGIAVEPRGAFIEVRVSNQLPAGDPPDVDTLFEPFVRGPGAKGDGVGLGLFLARLVARAHKGDLTLRWGPDDVVFTMTLPILA